MRSLLGTLSDLGLSVELLHIIKGMIMLFTAASCRSVVNSNQASRGPA